MQHTIKKGTTAVKNYVWSSSCLLFQYIKNLICIHDCTQNCLYNTKDCADGCPYFCLIWGYFVVSEMA